MNWRKGKNIYVKKNTKFEFVHIPVIITESGINDVVYNDFYIGKNAKVTIIAGCGIHNDHHKDSQHDGIHRFFLQEGAHVKYVEKHYGEGKGKGNRIFCVGWKIRGCGYPYRLYPQYRKSGWYRYGNLYVV